jgi:hypothetical protein
VPAWRAVSCGRPRAARDPSPASRRPWPRTASAGHGGVTGPVRPPRRRGLRRRRQRGRPHRRVRPPHAGAGRPGGGRRGRRPPPGWSARRCDGRWSVLAPARCRRPPARGHPRWSGVSSPGRVPAVRSSRPRSRWQRCTRRRSPWAGGSERSACRRRPTSTRTPAGSPAGDRPRSPGPRAATGGPCARPARPSVPAPPRAGTSRCRVRRRASGRAPSSRTAVLR